VLGSIAGVLTFTPYFHWRWEHSIHHATSGDLDRRGVGDVPTMTVEEYLKASRWKRLGYRMTRNPFVLFVLGPAFCSCFGSGFRRGIPGARKAVRLRDEYRHCSIRFSDELAGGVETVFDLPIDDGVDCRIGGCVAFLRATPV